jgi:hypothetical protein
MTHRPPSTPDDAVRAPGDIAAPGTPGAGENLCRQCAGRGERDGVPCIECAGTGKVIDAIGGA